MSVEVKPAAPPPSPAASAAASLARSEERMFAALQAVLENVRAAPWPLAETPRAETCAIALRLFDHIVRPPAGEFEATIKGWEEWTRGDLLLPEESASERIQAYFDHLSQQARGDPAASERLQRLRQAVRSGVEDGLPVLRVIVRLPTGISAQSTAVRVMGSLFHAARTTKAILQDRFDKLTDPFSADPDACWPVPYLRSYHVHANARAGAGAKRSKRIAHLASALRALVAQVATDRRMLREPWDRAAMVLIAAELADVCGRADRGIDLRPIMADVEQAIRLVETAGGRDHLAKELNGVGMLVKKLLSRGD